MKLIPPALEQVMRANAALPDEEKSALKPVVKLFTPDAGCTWLLSELDQDDIAFGLCDLGMGDPELDYVSLEELLSVRGPLGLPVERDIHWVAKHSLVEYADKASERGRI